MMEKTFKQKQIINFKSKYRNQNINYSLIFLLPTISIIRYLSNSHSQWNLIMCSLMTTSVIPIIFYRFHINEYSIHAVNGFIHTFFMYNQSLSFEQFVVFILNTLLIVLLKKLPTIITKCFTFVELAIVLQFHNSLVFSLLSFSKKIFLEYPQSIVEKDSNIVLLTCFIALYIALITVCFVQNVLLKSLLFTAFIPILTYFTFLFVFDIEIVQWLFIFITQKSLQRILLFFSWCVILSISCLFAFIFSKFSSSTANTCTRKIFHICLTIVFFCGLYVDRDFLDFSSKIMLIVLIYLEILRASNVQPFSLILESICASFRDEKDSGILTISHIYLFVGCFSTLWLSFDIHDEPIILLTTGIISVGIGDTFASIGGYQFGNHHWPNSKKTIEGTLCSFFAQTITLILLCQFFLHHALSSSIIAVIIILSCFSALIETFTVEHVDNLILPLLQYLFTLFIAYYSQSFLV